MIKNLRSIELLLLGLTDLPWNLEHIMYTFNVLELFPTNTKVIEHFSTKINTALPTVIIELFTSEYDDHKNFSHYAIIFDL